MNALTIVAFFVALAAATAGLLPGPAATILAGPSGYIARSGLVHAPLLGAHPLAYAAGPLAILPPGSGLEGQYVHDFTETLYDDGSYKPHIYGP